MARRSASLRPFIRYYGGKWRCALRYPAPVHDTIIEPFAGSAGYSLRYPQRNVILVEKYAPLAAMWRWLIGVSAAEVRRVPCVEAVDDLPAWVPEGARALVGFSMCNATHHPSRRLSAGLRARLERGYCEGWSEPMRERVAQQVDAIRHWKIIEGDYTEAPRVRGTWFVDPPYNNKAGSYYFGASAIDYAALGSWCTELPGQVMVCENAGADWLPFRDIGIIHRGFNKADGSCEVIWTNNGQVDLFSVA